MDLYFIITRRPDRMHTHTAAVLAVPERQKDRNYYVELVDATRAGPDRNFISNFMATPITSAEMVISVVSENSSLGCYDVG